MTVTDTGVRDVIIIGSGPAEHTAALYTARVDLRPPVFGSSIFIGGSLTGGRPGGRGWRRLRETN